MVNPNLKNNARDLQKEIEWFSDLLRRRLGHHLDETKKKKEVRIAAPLFKTARSIYASYVTMYKLDAAERIVLLLALLPFIQPYLIENILKEFSLSNKDIPEIGGVKGSHHGGMIPTGETAVFILGGTELEKRIEYSLLFSSKHKFNAFNLIKLEEVQENEPELSGVILVSKDAQVNLTSGMHYHPTFNSNFPAKIITTEYEPEQLIVPEETREGIEEIKLWLKHRDHLLTKWKFSKKINAGFKCLFHGPPGTGKSLAAALLGKDQDLPVYRIDLSMVIDKYIGETEKKIRRIFDMAQNKNWILFFDEADALFGKRAVTQTAQDRFANQEVSYLLMRMEEYNGLAILATNLKQNIDKAFLRRFNSVVHFMAPDEEQRLKLWKQSFSSETTRDKTVRLDLIAKNFSLTGANIMNVVRYASMMALKQGNNIITHSNLQEGIKKEMMKEQSLASETAN
jgi:AAA+ superfamily predicted ATPase